MLSYLLFTLQLAILIWAILTGRKRIFKVLKNAQTQEEESPFDVDGQILQYIRERGGMAYQSDIVRDLGLPKSTVHKAVRRLAERGLVEVRRQGRSNLIFSREAGQRPSA